jgi:hypothetical protein
MISDLIDVDAASELIDGVLHNSQPNAHAQLLGAKAFIICIVNAKEGFEYSIFHFARHTGVSARGKFNIV